jgi:hypothetical protein
MPNMQGANNITSSIGIAKTFASFGIMTSTRKQISSNALGVCTLHPHFFFVQLCKNKSYLAFVSFWTRTKQKRLSNYGLPFYARHRY